MFKSITVPYEFKRWAEYNFIVAWLLIVFGVVHHFVDLNENQTLYIFSSMAQVVAGIYGLTIAGYIFLRNQQDRFVDKDDTLTEIFERIQGDQHRLVMFITSLSVASIFAALLAIALREISNVYLRSISVDLASTLFVSAILWTAYFIAEVTRPEKISSASKIIKDEIANLSGMDAKAENTVASKNASKQENFEFTEMNNRNFLGDFLSNFNEVERLLVDFADSNLGRGLSSSISNLVTTENSNFKPSIGIRWPISRIVKALISEGRIDNLFGQEILEIIRYRNALVHGQDLMVDRNMLDRVAIAFEKLRTILG